jgi:hypothetical protein
MGAARSAARGAAAALSSRRGSDAARSARGTGAGAGAGAGAGPPAAFYTPLRDIAEEEPSKRGAAERPNAAADAAPMMLSA